MLVSTFAHAHEMTPTYPEWKYSIYDGLLVTKMEMFNKRDDVEYYEIAILDDQWNLVPFVSSFKIIRLDYLARVKFDVYINKKDRHRAEYICSKSKIRTKTKPTISSMICSRFK